MYIFFIGVLEMLIVTAWTKTVTRAKVVASGTISLINVFVWYYVLDTIVKNISDFSLIIEYAIGCAVGTMIGTYFVSRKNLARKFSSLLKRVKDKIFNSLRGTKIPSAHVKAS